MANYATLKAAIENVIKTNGSNAITGAILQTTLLSMIDSLGAGYQFAGVATPATNPGTPDYNVFYIAAEKGTYANFSNANVAGLSVLSYNGAWSVSTILVVDDQPTVGSNGIVKSRGIYNALANKVDVAIGDNLVNPNRITPHSAFNWNGTINDTVGDAYTISDYIPVNGQNIIANAFGYANSWAYGVVYDANYNKLRALTTNQYTYQNGDAFVRFAFSGTNRMANYGTTLMSYVPYTQLKYVDDALVQKIDKVQSYNMINPVNVISNRYFGASGALNTTELSEYYVDVEFHPVNGQNITSNCFQGSPGAIAGYVVYDESKNVVRAVIGSSKYTYQSGDAFVRFSFLGAGHEIAYAYYGDEDFGYIPFSDVPGISDIYKKIMSFSQDIDGRVEKEYTANLIDPTKVIDGKYISGSGYLADASAPGYGVTERIKIDGNNISIKGVAFTSASIRPWVAYDQSGAITRVGPQPASDSCLYEFDAENYPNDYYIRIGLVYGASGTPADNRANYGDTLIDIPFSDYAPVAELGVRVDALESAIAPAHVAVPYYPNKLYRVWNDMNTNRQYVVKMGLGRLLYIGSYSDGVCFENNKLHFLPLVPAQITQKGEQDLEYKVTDVTKSVKIRSSLASGGANARPRILVIGDSVTTGYGADSNKNPSWLPVAYWAFAKMFFEMDKVDNNTSGHDVLFTGINNGDFTLNYAGQTRSVRAKSVAKGGATLGELFQRYWGGDADNPFYDENEQTFSILAYLDKYRTMDDAGVRLVSQSADPHGETVVGSDGLAYKIGEYINTQDKLNSYDVCKPTHVFVNLNHNTTSNFTTDVAALLNIVQTELPSCVFAWLVIDSTGTGFPQDFPNFDPAILGMNDLHRKNNSHFSWFRDNLEDETNGVYLLGLNFIQPEAIDRPFVPIKINENGPEFNIADQNVIGANYHPNNICHCDWGYELYSFIKWLIS